MAIGSAGAIVPQSWAFLKEMGRILQQETGGAKSASYLLERLSVAVQRGNAAGRHLLDFITLNFYSDFDFYLFKFLLIHYCFLVLYCLLFVYCVLYCIMWYCIVLYCYAVLFRLFLCTIAEFLLILRRMCMSMYIPASFSGMRVCTKHTFMCKT